MGRTREKRGRVASFTVGALIGSVEFRKSQWSCIMLLELVGRGIAARALPRHPIDGRRYRGRQVVGCRREE